jgi:hypothetical protein
MRGECRERHARASVKARNFSRRLAWLTAASGKVSPGRGSQAQPSRSTGSSARESRGIGRAVVRTRASRSGCACPEYADRWRLDCQALPRPTRQPTRPAQPTDLRPPRARPAGRHGHTETFGAVTGRREASPCRQPSLEKVPVPSERQRRTSVVGLGRAPPVRSPAKQREQAHGKHNRQ